MLKVSHFMAISDGAKLSVSHLPIHHILPQVLTEINASRIQTWNVGTEVVRADHGPDAAAAQCFKYLKIFLQFVQFKICKVFFRLNYFIS